MLSLEEHRVATRMDCMASYIDNECEDNRILLTCTLGASFEAGSESVLYAVILTIHCKLTLTPVSTELNTDFDQILRLKSNNSK